MRHDLHTHSTYSDGSDDLETMLATAAQVGIEVLGVTDHVRADTRWIPRYVDELSRLRAASPLDVMIGIEAKVLDTDGKLDIPDDLTGIEYVAIADHQVPTPLGPSHPALVAESLAAGARDRFDVAEEVAASLVRAATNAPVQPMIAHLFSIFPKLGFREEQLPLPLIARFAQRLAATGAWVEINEKWRCPSSPVVAMLARAEIRIVAGTDSHSAAQLGGYDYITRVGGDVVQGPPVRVA